MCWPQPRPKLQCVAGMMTVKAAGGHTHDAVKHTYTHSRNEPSLTSLAAPSFARCKNFFMGTTAAGSDACTRAWKGGPLSATAATAEGRSRGCAGPFAHRRASAHRRHQHTAAQSQHRAAKHLNAAAIDTNRHMHTNLTVCGGRKTGLPGSTSGVDEDFVQYIKRKSGGSSVGRFVHAEPCSAVRAACRGAAACWGLLKSRVARPGRPHLHARPRSGTPPRWPGSSATAASS